MRMFSRSPSERAALVARKADHDADVVAAALDPLRLLAVERLGTCRPRSCSVRPRFSAAGLMPSFISSLPARNESVTS